MATAKMARATDGDMHDGTSTAGVMAGVTMQDLMAGHAIFTVVTNLTGVSLTYKITKSDDVNARGVYTYFVAVLSGPDNGSDYAYMGLLVFENNRYVIKSTKASQINKKSQSYVVIDWLLKKLSTNQVYDYVKSDCGGAHVLMAGHCLRCGRTLTVESSINAMYGPVCAGKVWG